jgi:hypothetical protein
MESLNPRLVDVESTTCGPSLRLEQRLVNLRARKIRSWARAVVPSYLRRRVQEFKRQPVPAIITECIAQQLRASAPASGYFPRAHALDALARLGANHAYGLLTLTSAIEYFETGASTLERYSEVPF